MKLSRDQFHLPTRVADNDRQAQSNVNTGNFDLVTRTSTFETMAVEIGFKNLGFRLKNL